MGGYCKSAIENSQIIYSFILSFSLSVTACESIIIEKFLNLKNYEEEIYSNALYACLEHLFAFGATLH